MLTDDFMDDFSNRVADKVAARLRSELQPPRDDWLSAKEAAEYLSISVSTLHKLSAKREIPCSQRSEHGRLHFQRSALDAWRGSE